MLWRWNSMGACVTDHDGGRSSLSRVSIRLVYPEVSIVAGGIRAIDCLRRNRFGLPVDASADRDSDGFSNAVAIRCRLDYFRGTDRDRFDLVDSATEAPGQRVASVFVKPQRISCEGRSAKTCN